MGYTGHPFNTDLGLNYMQARYYDPAIGRFYSSDPAETHDIHSVNRYSYANNNPYKYTDPNGEFAQVIFGAIAGAVGGYVASGEGFANTAIGIVSGALAGAAVGVALPQASHAAGMAAAGMISSVAGQVIGSTVSAVADKGIENISLSDVKVDAVTTVAGGLGAGLGGIVAKGVANMTMKPLVGQSVKTLSQLGGPTNAGLAAGAVVEGAVIGAAEKVAPVIKEAIKDGL
jgi:RHS repeat-associated protein